MKLNKLVVKGKGKQVAKVMKEGKVAAVKLEPTDKTSVLDMQAISVTSLHQLVVPLSTHSLMQTPIFIWILLLIRHILQKSSPPLTFYFWTLRLGLDSSTQNLS